MAKRSSDADALPPCYAVVLPGLEPIAAEEITEDLGGEVKRTERGVVVFRVAAMDALLRLRTTEDVFLYAWGTDKLSYRADALESIRRWTARETDWNNLLRLHHSLRPRPKGKPTYRLVTQMTGEHGYRRTDARAALARGLAGKLPGSWRHAEENAAVEIWLTIDGATAVCGLRLSDHSMRHRTYKREHLPASLRPTLAAAMARLAGARPGHVVLDPMCGAGTILAEVLERARKQRQGDKETRRQGDWDYDEMAERETAMHKESAFTLSPGLPVSWSPGLVHIWGGDIDRSALHAAGINLRRLGPVLLARWDAVRLPLDDQSVDRLVSNPPFGKQLSRPEDIGPLYRRMVTSYDRVLRPAGRAVLLVSDMGALMEAAAGVGWKRERQLRVRVLGQAAHISVWRKPG